MDDFKDLGQKLVNSSSLVITGLEVVFLLPKFLDSTSLEIPALNVVGPGQCPQFKVGTSDENWMHSREDEQVLFYGVQVPVHYFAGM